VKVFQILFFLILLNVSFVLLNVTGIFLYVPNTEFAEGEGNYAWGYWADENSIMTLIFVEISAAIGIGAFLSRYGVNPYLTAAYTLFLMTFIALYGMFVMVLDEVGNQMGEAKVIMNYIIVILTIIMAVLVFYTAIQMAVGGGKGFE